MKTLCDHCSLEPSLTCCPDSEAHTSPASSIAVPALPSPEVKNEAFSYDYMPDDMFVDDIA